MARGMRSATLDEKALREAAAAGAVHSNAYRDPDGPRFEGSEEEWLIEHAECIVRRYIVVAGKLDRLLLLAQALRVIRDTTSGYSANVARRALEEANVSDPVEDGSGE